MFLFSKSLRNNRNESANQNMTELISLSPGGSINSSLVLAHHPQGARNRSPEPEMEKVMKLIFMTGLRSTVAHRKYHGLRKQYS